MNGQLRDQPLAELIREISDEHLSGALRLSRERVQAAIYFDAGQIVYARLNLRTHRLVPLLRRWNPDDERFTRVLTEEMTDEDAASALAAAGTVTRDEISRLHERQVQESLRLPLLWTDGIWDFNPRTRLTEEPRVTLDEQEMLMESVRRFPPEVAGSRLANDGEMISLKGNPGARLRLTTAEAFVLSRINAGEPIRLGALVAISGLPEPDARQAIYALVLGGLLARSHVPRVISGTKSGQATHATKIQTAAIPAAARAASAGGKTMTSVADSSPPVADTRTELNALFDRSEAGDFYEIIGVGRSASASEIKRRYYALAKRFHPDRFHRETDEQTRSRVEHAFARIAQAYETLKDTNLRASYDLKLSVMERGGTSSRGAQRGSNNASGSAAGLQQRAEEQFQQGLMAFERRDNPAAVIHFAHAAKLFPNQSRYRAYHGRALGRDSRTRRQAEAELQAAIALDARNISYRVMLAELYVEIGLHRRAEGELRRALTLDPGHAGAIDMLAKLKRMEAST